MLCRVGNDPSWEWPKWAANVPVENCVLLENSEVDSPQMVVYEPTLLGTHQSSH